MSRSEQTVFLLASLAIGTFLVYRFYLWLLAPPRMRDPWDDGVAKTLLDDSIAPVCPHCSAPQEGQGWFCPDCGAPTGLYANVLPGVYIYTVGHCARLGLRHPNRWNPLIGLGYVLVAFGWFSILGIFYIAFLFANREREKPVIPLIDPSDPPPAMPGIK